MTNTRLWTISELGSEGELCDFAYHWNLFTAESPILNPNFLLIVSRWMAKQKNLKEMVID